MYFRDNDQNYGFENEGGNGYLHLKTYYHNPRIIFQENICQPSTINDYVLIETFRHKNINSIFVRGCEIAAISFNI